MIKAGPQIPSFTYAGVPDVELFDKVAEQKVAAFTGDQCLDWRAADDATEARVGARFVIGDRESAAAQSRALVDMGFDGFTVNLPADGADTTAVERVGAILADAMA